MWTSLGRAESVHISEPSTVVDTLYCRLYRENKRAGRKVSIKEECPHRRSVHKGELYCIIIVLSHTGAEMAKGTARLETKVKSTLGVYSLD